MYQPPNPGFQQLNWIGYLPATNRPGRLGCFPLRQAGQHGHQGFSVSAAFVRQRGVGFFHEGRKYRSSL